MGKLIQRPLMKTPLLTLAFALLLSPAHAALTLEGQVETVNGTKFLLKNEKGQFSGWRTLGEQFDGFSLMAYDHAHQRLTVEKDGETHTLRPGARDRMLVSQLLGNAPRKTPAPRAENETPTVEVSLDGETFFPVHGDADGLSALRSRLLAAPDPLTSLYVRFPHRVALKLARQISQVSQECGAKVILLPTPTSTAR